VPVQPEPVAEPVLVSPEPVSESVPEQAEPVLVSPESVSEVLPLQPEPVAEPVLVSSEPVLESVSVQPEPVAEPVLASPEPASELVAVQAESGLDSALDQPEPFADLVTGLTDLLVDFKSPTPAPFADLLTDLNELLADLMSGSSDNMEELILDQPEESLAEAALLQPEPVTDVTSAQPESLADVTPELNEVPAEVSSSQAAAAQLSATEQLPEAEQMSVAEQMPVTEQLPLAEQTAASASPKRFGLFKLSRSEKKLRSPIAILSDLLFFLAIGAILLSALGFSSRSGAPKMFLGYSYFTVLTSSMQSEIPKASFILVRHIDPQQIKVGDVVTYMLDANTSVTHKVINIYDNYNNSGARGFQTKGVNNPDPDKDIVYAANIVGKVIFSVPVAGAVISYLAANLYLVFILFGLCMVISFSIRGLLNDPGRKNALEKS